MTLYQLINDPIHLSIIVQLVRNGVIKDATIIQHLAIYERFYQLDGNKGDRYKKLGKEFGQHPNSIQRIILKLNQEAR